MSTKSNSWLTPKPDDVSAFLTAAAVTAGSSVVTSTMGGTSVEVVLAAEVARVRGTILSAGRVPLSSTEGSVPPEGFKHTVVLALQTLVASVPSLAEFVAGEAFKRNVDKAEAWLEAVAKGQTVTVPPTEEQDEDFVQLTSCGDATGELTSDSAIQDMSTDGVTTQ